jgi:hypothetical protein
MDVQEVGGGRGVQRLIRFSRGTLLHGVSK